VPLAVIGLPLTVKIDGAVKATEVTVPEPEPDAPVGPVGPGVVETAPVGPVGPATVEAAPVGPVAPTAPVGPATVLAAPVGPVGPVTLAPVGPTLPVGPTTVDAAPVGPVGPVMLAPVGPIAPVGPATVDAAPVAPVGPVGPVGPCIPGATQDAGVVQVNVAEERELTSEIEAQTTFVGLVGGVVDQPVGGTPTLVAKFQEPPVGVAGAVADSLKINHSKYVPPKLTVLPYKPTDSELP